MKKLNLRTFLIGVVGGAVLAAVVMAGTAAAARGSAAAVSTAKTPLGRILVNANGRTLYLFEKDGKAMSACTGPCAKFWPPLTTAGKPLATGGATAKLLGTLKRTDGKLQVTYAGHPLYTFSLDKAKGQTHGEGMSAFGAEWYVVGTKGAKIEKPAAATNGGYGSDDSAGKYGGSYGG